MGPNICYADTLVSYLSLWLNYQFQKLKQFISTYLKYSHDLLRCLKSLLFTANTNSIYTNIDTDHSINVTELWLNSLHLPKDYPLGAVKNAMVIVTKIIFSNGATRNFLQLLGTAMGTSAACM
ncbi:hypothetical protein ACHAWF_018893 [Thalassiosira exigua]